MITNPTTLPLFDFEVDWSPNLKATMRYPSNLASSPHGDEQRELLSTVPIRSLKLQVKTESLVESRRFHQFMRDNIGRKVVVPKWIEAVRTMSAASGSSIAVVTTAWREFVQDGWAIIWNFDDSVSCELFQIASVSDASLGVSGALSGTYPVGSIVAPVMVARFRGSDTEVQWRHSDSAGGAVELVECVEESSAYAPRIPSTTVWNPLDIAGTKRLWLDDSRLVGLDGESIAQWPDRSGCGHHMTQATAGLRPILKTGILGTRSVARFAGVDDASGKWIATTHDMSWIQSMLIVGKRTQPAEEIGEFGNDRYRGFVCNNDEPWTWFDDHWLNGSSTLPNFYFPQHGIIVGSVRLSPAYYSYFRIGFASGGKYFLNGDIACLVAYDSALSDSDRQKLEGWAAWTYGLQSLLPALHPYKLAAP